MAGCPGLTWQQAQEIVNFSVSVTADRYQLSSQAGAIDTAALRAVPTGGVAPYTYAWSVSDPHDENANFLLDSLQGPSVDFRAAGSDGPYEVRCRVTDSAGSEIQTRTILRVGTSVGLDITTERFGVIAGGGSNGRVTLHLTPQSGTPPYTVSWMVTGPDGQTDNARLSTTNPFAPVFTSGSSVGTYTLTATITDAKGNRSFKSIIVMVGQTLGLDVIADRGSVLPGGGEDGTATLLATPIGGKEPYSYDWEVNGPDGEIENELLWDSKVRTPKFESADETGTFLIRCAVTDAAGAILIGSTTLKVGQDVAVDVTADHVALPGAESSEKSHLSADVRGGHEPVKVRWEVVGPDGLDASARLNSTTARQCTFTPGSANGAFLIRCTATDSEGVSTADSVVISVGGSLSVAISSEKTSLPAGGASSTGTTRLKADIRGGVPPYTYSWSVVDPAGDEENNRLSSTTGSAPTFTGSSDVGAYAVICKITDAEGMSAVDSVHINVGQPLNVDVTADKQALVGGGGVSGQAQLITTVTGGAAPYDFEWSVIGPNNAPAPSRLSDLSVSNPVFTSDLVTGTYRLILTTTDSLGIVFVDSIALVVSSTGGGAAGQNLAIDVTLDRSPIFPSGDTSEITGTSIGGVAPIEYAWTLTRPNGTTNNALLSSTTDPVVTFTSPATQGTYRIRCTVTDAVGNLATDSVQCNVTDSFALNLTADATEVLPGGAVNLFADQEGAVANITYSWSCLNEGGAASGTFTTGSGGAGVASQTVAGDTVNAWTAPGTGVGTYRIQVTMVDARGYTAVDSVQVMVRASLALDVTAAMTEVLPGGTVDLDVDQNGGTPNITYAWTCKNESGTAAGTFTVGSTGAGAALQTAAGDTSNAWTAPGTGVGTYRIQCVMTDSRGNTAIDSVQVFVRPPVALDLTASAIDVLPGTAVNLLADQTGGTPNMTYAWTCLDESNAAAGAFTTGSTGVGSASQTVAGDASNVWTAPGAGVGTYRVKVTMTDARGNTAVDSVQIVVRTPLTLDLTSTAVYILPGAAVTLSADENGGTPNMTYTWTCVDESSAAAGAFTTGSTGVGAATQAGQAGDVTNIWTAPGGGVGTYRIEVTVLDSRGYTATDSVHVIVDTPLTLDLTSSAVYILPGAAVTLYADENGGTPNMTYTWTCVDESSAAAGAFTTGSTGVGAATQAGQAGDVTNIWTAPGGGVGTYRIEVTVLDSRGYTATDSVHVIVDTPLTLDLTSSAVYILPGAAVTLYADENGGTPNMTYTWTCVNESNAAAGAFTTGSTGVGAATQAGQAGDVTNIWTAPGGGVGTYRIEVTVLDSRGYTATDSVHVIVDTPLTLDLTSSAVYILPGAAVTLYADENGGTANMTYTWSCIDESSMAAGAFTTGSTGVGAATQAGQAGDVTNIWTAPGGGVGTYIIEVTVLDARGYTATDSVEIIVNTPLTLDLTASFVEVLPGSAVNLYADQNGGVPNLTYTWTCVNESNAAAGAFTTGSTGVGAATQVVAGDATNIWTAPAAGASSLGTYRIEVALVDSRGYSAYDSVHIVVRNPLSLDLSADDNFVAPSTTVNLLADKTGGEQPYNYAWTAKNSSGVAAGAFTTGSTGVGTAAQNAQAGDVTNAWSVAVEDTYTITCTVTDDAGQTFTDSISIVVTRQQPFTLDVSADRLILVPGETINLFADQTGGTPNFNYAWQVLDEAGANAGTLGAANQNGLAGDAANTWQAPSGDVEGTYRIFCTVTDAVNRTVTDSLQVEISWIVIQNYFPAPPAASTTSILATSILGLSSMNAYPGKTFDVTLVNPSLPRNFVITISDSDNSISGGSVRIIGMNARGESVTEEVVIPASGGGGSTTTCTVPFATVSEVHCYDFAGVSTGGSWDQVSIGRGLKFGLTDEIQSASDVLYTIEGSTIYTSGYTVDAGADTQGITFANAPNGTRNYIVVFRTY